MRNSNSRGTSFFYPRQTILNSLLSKFTKPSHENSAPSQNQSKIITQLNIIQTATFQYPIQQENLVI